MSQSVTVSATNTLINPDQAGAVSQIGTTTIQRGRVPCPDVRCRTSSTRSRDGSTKATPCCTRAARNIRRSLWSMAFLCTDNRSPSFGPEIEADDVESMSIYTAGFPAEYGRKMGGVVEVNTLRESQSGFHGQVVLSGGSFDTAGRFCPSPVRLGQECIRRQRQRGHDQPLPESGRHLRTTPTAEHSAIFRPTISAI